MNHLIWLINYNLIKYLNLKNSFGGGVSTEILDILNKLKIFITSINKSVIYFDETNTNKFKLDEDIEIIQLHIINDSIDTNKSIYDNLEVIIQNYFDIQTGGVLNNVESEEIISSLKSLIVLGKGSYGIIYDAPKYSLSKCSYKTRNRFNFSKRFTIYGKNT